MKKRLVAVVVMLVCVAQMALVASERVMSGVIPEADVMFYLDAVHGKETGFGKALKAFEAAHANDPSLKGKNAEGKVKDMAEVKEFFKKLGYDNLDDVVAKMCGSLTFKLDEEGDVQGIENFAVAVELAKPLDILKALAVLKKEAEKEKDDDLKITFGVMDGMPSIVLEDMDEDRDELGGLKRLAMVIVDAKSVVLGSEGVLKDVVARNKALKTVEMDAYFKTIKGDDFFLALAMTPKIKKSCQAMTAEMPQLASLAEAQGFGIVLKLSDEAMYFDLCMGMKTREDAEKAKTNIIDSFVMPMVMLALPSIRQEVGGELPMLDSIKGQAVDNIVKLGCKITMKDVEILYGVY